MFAGALAMSNAIDHGTSPAWVTSVNRRGYWILGTLALLAGGPGTLAAAIGWLAVGEPSRPFPGASAERSRQQADGAGSA
jgi:hypothetical protein